MWGITVDIILISLLLVIIIVLASITFYLLFSTFKTILKWTTRHSKSQLSPSVRLLVIGSFIYSIASVFIGPTIVFNLDFFVFGENRLAWSGSLMDCSDSSWGSREEQERVYQAVRTIARTASGILLAIGFGLLMAVRLQRERMGEVVAIRTALMIIVMLCGYVAILALANWLWVACI